MDMGNFKLIVENGLLNHDTARQLYGFAAWAYRRTGKDKEISLDVDYKHLRRKWSQK